MIHIEQAIIVEGKYDKIKLASLTDAVIIVTNGFGIFKDKEMQELIRFYAKNKGIIILTDSDSAGFKIRSMIKNIAAGGSIINVYLPEILGKEKRKAMPSKEGLLGVEGVDAEVIIKAFDKAGVANTIVDKSDPVTEMDFFEDGLSGRPFSREMRKRLLKKLGLPSLITSKALLEALNSMMTRTKYKELVAEITD